MRDNRKLLIKVLFELPLLVSHIRLKTFLVSHMRLKFFRCDLCYCQNILQNMSTIMQHLQGFVNKDCYNHEKCFNSTFLKYLKFHLN